MSKKKQPMKPTPRSAKSRQGAEQNRFIQIAALVVIVLVVAAIIWAVVSSQTPAQSTKNTAVSARQYSAPPQMTIDKTKQYTATVKMAKGGEFVIQLYPDKAPVTVNNFVFLAREGFYNGVTFHRV